MNKEEKKAIEDMNRFANGIDMSCVTARQMQIILNLIEKLQDDKIKLIKSLELYNMQGSNIKLEIYIKDNFISKKKIKDKIENLQNEKEEYYSQYKIDELNDKIQVLQELLEGDN